MGKILYFEAHIDAPEIDVQIGAFEVKIEDLRDIRMDVRLTIRHIGLL